MSVRTALRPFAALLVSAALTMAALINDAIATEAEVSASELRALVQDVTITGQYDTGEAYSEYHAPDGRVLGHNRRSANQDSCWDIRRDMVCYYYAKGQTPGTFCWKLERIGTAGIKALLVEPDYKSTIIGLLQAGNPHGHSDNGNPWKCEPLLSNKSTPRPSLARHDSIRRPSR
jgi:hypothetical protein